LGFVSFYVFGTLAVTGLWNPIQYVRDIAKNLRKTCRFNNKI